MVQRRLTVAPRAAEFSSVTKSVPQPQHLLLEHPRGPDWVHPSIAVHDTGVIGLGLVAMEMIPRTSKVILFGGALMSWREVTQLPEDMWDIPFQVADDIFFGIPRREDIGVGERMNHSCNPNTGFVSEMTLVAIRDILPGEDVTMDYGTCSSMESYRLICRCGDKNCRGVITGDDWKLPDLQHRLRGYFQPYLQEKIAQQRSRGFRFALSSMLRSAADALSKEK